MLYEIINNAKGKIEMLPIKDRDYVDKEHVIEVPEYNLKIFFMKESDSNALEMVEKLLVDSFENRVFNK